MQRNDHHPMKRAAAAAAIGALAFAAAPLAAGAAEAPAPKNVIVMIGDGMGFNHVDHTSLFEHGTSNWQVDGDPGAEIARQEGYGKTPAQVYERFDEALAMSHHSLNSPVYDPAGAWGEFDWAKHNPTDSAASGTALATGEKTWNGKFGVDPDNQPKTNVAEAAAEKGRATGVVSSVPFGHATPAAWGAHVEHRQQYHDIAQQMIDGPLDVIIGAGHPLFDDDAQPREAKWKWLSEEQYAHLSEQDSGREFVEDSGRLTAIAGGETLPERLFGLVPVAETLQYNRSALADNEPRRDAGRPEGERLAEGSLLPGEAQKNDVPPLADLSSAALNVLGQNDEGLFLMIEGVAIDWAGHDNATAGNIEEMIDFNRAVERVTQWVEQNSSWEETLLLVTADHETGYLNGENSPKRWTHVTGNAGENPIDGWYSGDHTNHLVPLFAHGAGAETIRSYVKGVDPVRGEYVDNTDIAKIGFDLLANAKAPAPSEETTTTTTTEPVEETTGQVPPAEEPEPKEPPAEDGDRQPGDGEPHGDEPRGEIRESAPGESAPAPGTTAPSGTAGGPRGGSLAATGASVLGLVGLAGALVAAGAGAVALGKRRSRG